MTVVRFLLVIQSFDFVHSNAVIEHVGGFFDQQRFLHELIRVANKGVFFSTPNKFFPIEMHTNVFFLHYLPKKIFDKLLCTMGKSWATGDYMFLLSKNDLIKLEKSIKLDGYNQGSLSIHKERLFGCSYQLLGMIKR